MGLEDITVGQLHKVQTMVPGGSDFLEKLGEYILSDDDIDACQQRVECLKNIIWLIEKKPADSKMPEDVPQDNSKLELESMTDNKNDMENATKNKDMDKEETFSKDEAEEMTFDETKCDTIEGVEKSTTDMQIATENESKEASVNVNTSNELKDEKQREGTDNAAQIVTEEKTVVVDTCDETTGIETEEHENKQNITQNTENKDIENKDKTVENKKIRSN